MELSGELETVVLTNKLFGSKFTFVMERIGGDGDKFTLANVSNPFKKLHITKDCLIDFVSSPPCKENVLSLRADSNYESGQVFLLQTVTPINSYKQKKETRNYNIGSSKAVACVGVDSFGSLRIGFESPTIDNNDNSPIGFHFYVSFSSVSIIADSSSVCAGIPTYRSTFQCYRWQYRRFALEGFLHLPALIENDRLDLCRKKLHRALGTPGVVVKGGVQGGEAGKFVGGLSQCGEVTQLLEGRLAAAIKAFIGSGGYDKSNLGAQIAFRFPEIDSDSSSAPKWHTDGLRQGKAHPFSLLVGVCLSDVHSPDSGNLLLWPGSHFVMHRCKVDEHGALDINNLHKMLSHPIFSDCCSPTTMQHFPQNSSVECSESTTSVNREGQHDNEPNLPSLGKPVQLIASAGDCVFLHPDLAHAGGVNLSADIREMIYFRLKMKMSAASVAVAAESTMDDLETASSGWNDVVRQHALDMWADLPGLAMALSEGDELTRIMQLYYYGVL